MAGNTILSILAKLGLDASDFKKGLGDAESQAASSGSKIANNLAAVGGGIVTGGLMAAGAAVTALGGFLASTVEPASNLGESINAVNVVFGDGAQAILDYGATAAQTVGLSNSEFNSLATTTGAFLQNVGFDANTAGEETIRLAERASDLASVFNTDVGSALGAIQSGLKGEFNPLEQFGVKLNAAAIEAKALEMGLGDSTGALDDSAKAAAALELIYEQTAKVQGDFSNTSTGLANSQRIISSTFTDIQAKIGSALLPSLEELAGMLSGLFSDPQFLAFLDAFAVQVGNIASAVVAYIPVVIQWFQMAFAWLGENQGVVIGVLAAIGAAIAAFVWVTVIPALIAFLTAAAPVILIMALVGAAAYLLYQAWTTNFGGIQEIVAGLWAKLQPVFEQVKTWLEVNIPIALAALAGFWQNTLLPAIQAVWGWMQSVLFPFLGSLANLIGTVLGLAISVLAGLWQNVLQPALEDVWPILQDIGAFVGGALTDAFGWLSGAIQTATKWFSDLAAMLAGLKIPDWLTPGSPTPLQLGLEGIGKAARTLASLQMPQLEASLEFSQQPFGVSVPTVNSQSSRDEFSQGRDVIDYDQLARVLRDAIMQVVG